MAIIILKSSAKTLTGQNKIPEDDQNISDVADFHQREATRHQDVIQENTVNRRNKDPYMRHQKRTKFHLLNISKNMKKLHQVITKIKNTPRRVSPI